MNRRLICYVAVLTILAGTVCGCQKKKNVEGKVSKPEIPVASDSDEDSDELPSETSGSGSDVDGASSKNVELDPDRILFTYEYSNMAWGYQSRVIVIMGDGRYYETSNPLLRSSSGAQADYDSRLIAQIRTITQAQAAFRINNDYLMELYTVASQVDPNASKTSRHAMCDYGQYNIFYWDEEGNKVLCASKGDVEYTINDPNAQLVEQMWDNLDDHAEDLNGNGSLRVYIDPSAPIKTVHCGYIELPDGSSGKYVFKNYADFLKAAEEWGLNLDELNITDDAIYLDQPVFVQFDLFNTMGYNRNYVALATDGEKYFFIESDECSDPGPDDVVPQALDGFVTVGIYPSNDKNQDLSALKTFDGSLWELYEVS